MKNTLKQLGLVLGTIVILLGFGAGATYLAQASATTLRFVQTPSIHLYTGLSAVATTARVTPYPKDLDGVKLTITDFGSNPTFTVDPKVSGYEEIIGFTGITDNGDNTATLTGLSRDLVSKYPYTTTGTGKIHGAGSTVVFSNNPQMYGRFATLENDQTFTGTNTFSSTVQPVYSANPTFTNPLALVDKFYADSLTIAGAPTSTFSGMGVVWLASNAQVSAGTASSTTGAPLVIPSKVASSTYNGSTVFQGLIPALRSTFNIDPNFIATSTGNNYNWGGLHSFTATTTMATSTVASSTISGTLNVNNLNVIGATTGVGTWKLLLSTTTTQAMANATTTFAAATDLHIVLYIPAMTQTSVCLQFNSDGSTSNYSANTFYNYAVNGSFGGTETTRGNMILLENNNATTTDMYFVIDGKNTTTKRKIFNWTGTESDSGVHFGAVIQGTGVWNNTSAQITTMAILSNNGSCGSFNIPAGAIFNVYGQ